MIAGKHINKIVLLAVAAALVFSIGAVILAPRLLKDADLGITMGYEEMIFDTSKPVVINIQMDGDEWQSMLDTATQELYHQCDVVINGTKFQGVGIRPKGNTSLSSIAMNPDTERFSFKLEFDQFVDGQSAWGLDKLCLNNNYADATNMKEALIYDMYQYLGADASLYNYAEIYVNGEYWGVYLALEAVEDSFMLRNYGAEKGALYKPDTMGMSRDGNGWGGDDDRPRRTSEEPEPTETPEPTPEPTATPVPTAEPDPMPPSGELSESMQEYIAASEESGSASGESRREGRFPDFGSGPGGGMFGSGGANLNYIDDDLSSYSTIWGCAVTDTTTADHRRVVQALKNISEGENLEESMDIDNLLRLMAVHNFSVNGDSLSGGMAHNYYLYEANGRLNILPWDYNLAFGGMGMGGNSAKSVVNEPIDDSWQSTNFFDPLLENEEYLAKYHEYYRQLVEGYIFGGLFDEFYERTRDQIDDLVTNDPNALYDYEEYDAAAETLYQLVDLRAESILGQLNGTIPATTSGQRADDSALIEADNVDISVMGTMSMGGSFGGGGGFPGGANPFRSRRSRNASGETASGEQDGTASGETASGEPAEAASGEPAGLTEDASGEDTGTASAEESGTVRAGQASGETAAAASDEAAGPVSDEQNGDASDETAGSGESEDEDGASREERSGRRSGSGEMSQRIDTGTKWLLAVCVIFLAAGIVFAVRFKKKG